MTKTTEQINEWFKKMRNKQPGNDVNRILGIDPSFTKYGDKTVETTIKP